jgi:hypothetical protein
MGDLGKGGSGARIAGGRSLTRPLRTLLFNPSSRDRLDELATKARTQAPVALSLAGWFGSPILEISKFQVPESAALHVLAPGLDWVPIRV